MPDPRSAPVTVPAVRAAKARDGHAPLVMVTAYDAPGRPDRRRRWRRPCIRWATRSPMWCSATRTPCR